MQPETPTRPPAAVLRDWLHEDAAPLWWELGADHAGGGFHDALDGAGRPVIGPYRCRVQARQVYVYATAGRLGWCGPWREAVEHGLGFLLERFLRRDGLFRLRVDVDGEPEDESAPLYEQAFAALALGAASAVLPERAGGLTATADRLLETLTATRRHDRGGFTELGPTPFQANPHMHLFEAALTWSETGGWSAVADEIAELALTRFIDPRAGLNELFDADWRATGGALEPGHQYEWAWLLERWGRMRGRPDACAAARNLFSAGERGVDPARGAAVGALTPEGRVVDDRARLWPQTERLKAALILGDGAAATEAATAVTGYVAREPRGLWYEYRFADGRYDLGPAPASSFYHLTCAIAELGAARD